MLTSAVSFTFVVKVLCFLILSSSIETACCHTVFANHSSSFDSSFFGSSFAGVFRISLVVISPCGIGIVAPIY